MPANKDDGAKEEKSTCKQVPPIVKNTSALLSKETWKTCPKCEHILKEGFKNNLHFTLAYSRCRCHRTWRYTVDRLSSSSTDQLARSARVAAYSMKPNLYTVPALDLKGIPLPTLSRKFSSLSYHHSLSRSLAHHKRMAGRLNTPYQPPTALLPMIVAAASNEQVSDHATEKTSKAPTNKLAANKSPSHGTSCTTLAVKSPSDDISSTSSAKLTPKSPSDMHTSFTKLTVKSPPDSTNPSIPKLPQITSTSSDTIDQPIRSFTRITRPQTRSFEFVHLLKYVSTESRTIASKVFSMIDHNGDGHLTFSEVIVGIEIITGTIANLANYLSPIYHLLGDSTYFGKRDFILCHTLAEIIKKSSKLVPKLSYAQSVDFFNNTLKPVMAKLVTIAIEGKVSLNDIEATVKTPGGNSGKVVAFTKSRALKVCEEGKLSLLQLMALAPHLLCCHG